LSWQQTSISYKYQNTWGFISSPTFNLIFRQEVDGLKRKGGPYASAIVHLSLENTKTINVCYQCIKNSVTFRRICIQSGPKVFLPNTFSRIDGNELASQFVEGYQRCELCIAHGGYYFEYFLWTK
jgi:hypothetical protein